MTLFIARQKKGAENSRALPESRALPVPIGFEALADALRSAGDTVATAEELGRAAARDGASIGEVLDDVLRTYLAIGAGEPTFDVTTAVSVAWAEDALQHLQGVSCEDPLTGLASLSHVRSRLAEVYREASRAGTAVTASHALVVVELDVDGSPGNHFDQVLRLVDAAVSVRVAYPGEETIGQLSARRVLAVVRRGANMGAPVSVLRGLLADWQRRGGLSSRVWIEGLPATPDSAEALLDELAR